MSFTSKIILLIFCVTQTISAQVSSFHKTFTGQNTVTWSGGQPTFFNSILAYENNLIHVWKDMLISFPGSNHSKYDYNGTQVIPYKRVMAVGHKPEFLLPSGNSFLVIGDNGTVAYVGRMDTTAYTPVYNNRYFTNSTWLKVRDAVMLSNGDVAVVGGLVGSGPDTVGFYMRMNPVTSSVVAQCTLSANSSTNTQLHSITEMSNGSLFVTGVYAGNSFIAKVTNNSNPVFSSAWATQIAVGKIRRINNSKLVCYTHNQLSRIDSNLLLLASAQCRTLNAPGTGKTVYANNRFHRVSNGAKELVIIDTTFSSVISNSYNVPGRFFQPDVTTRGASIFMTYLDSTTVGFTGSTYTANIALFKVNDQGVSPCSSALNYSLTTITTPSSSTISVSSGTLLQQAAGSSGGGSITVTFSNNCIATAISEYHSVDFSFSRNVNEYQVKAETGITYFKIYDITGREVAGAKPMASEFLFSTENLPEGIYIFYAETEDHQAVKRKIYR